MTANGNSGVQERVLPASPVGKPYSARVIDCDFVVAQNMEMAWIIVMEVRTPRPYRGHPLVWAIRLDADRPESFRDAVLTLTRCGVDPKLQWEGEIPAEMKGRTLTFNYTPAQMSPLGGVEQERVEIVGCVFAPVKKERK